MMKEYRGDLAAAGSGDVVMFAGGSNQGVFTNLVSVVRLTAFFTFNLIEDNNLALSVNRSKLVGASSGEFIVFAGGTGYVLSSLMRDKRKITERDRENACNITHYTSYFGPVSAVDIYHVYTNGTIEHWTSTITARNGFTGCGLPEGLFIFGGYARKIDRLNLPDSDLNIL